MVGQIALAGIWSDLLAAKGLTAAQMEPAQKNGRSHRAKALQLLLQRISQLAFD